MGETDPAGAPRRAPAGASRLGRELRQLHLERDVAARFGFATFAEYLKDRESRGWGHTRIAREIGQNRDWVRSARKRYEQNQVERVNSVDRHVV